VEYLDVADGLGVSAEKVAQVVAALDQFLVPGQDSTALQGVSGSVCVRLPFPANHQYSESPVACTLFRSGDNPA
jgi:hypothetical protein